MKAIFCGGCFDIRALPHEPGEEVTCLCGNVKGWWTNPQAGTAKVWARNRDLARVIGFNNQFLLAAFGGGSMGDEKWQQVHDRATNAPGYLFDKGRRGCPVVIILIGQSNDVTWAPDEEPAPGAPPPEPPDIDHGRRYG